MRFLHQSMIGLMLATTPAISQEIVTTPLDDILQQLAPVPQDNSTQDTTRVEVAGGVGGELRILDKLTGAVTDLSLQPGDVALVGLLSVSLVECRYTIDTQACVAFIYIEILDRKENQALFAGWLLASAPALNAMDHPRYDVWALRCITS